MKLKCPKCNSIAMIGAGYALRKGGKVHSSKCTICGYVCTDNKLIKGIKIIQTEKTIELKKEQPKIKLIDKGHIL